MLRTHSDTKGFTTAGRQVNRSQSAVSMQIKSLEDEVGKPLFDRSISGILDAVRAGLAIAPIVKSNVPPDLKTVGIENGLPVLPISNVVLHTVKAPTPETVTCFAGYLIKAFREKG